MSKLQTKLARLRESFKDKIPADIRNKMHQATVELQESGAEDQVAKVSDRVTEFTLPNEQGQNRSLQELTANGPLAITYYRGVW